MENLFITWMEEVRGFFYVADCVRVKVIFNHSNLMCAMQSTDYTNEHILVFHFHHSCNKNLGTTIFYCKAFLLMLFISSYQNQMI